MQMFEWEIEIEFNSYSQLMLVAWLYRVLFKPKGYRELVHHQLKLKGRSIHYKQGQSTLWMIDTQNFSHFQKLTSNSSIKQKSYEVIVHTKCGDMHSIECSLGNNKFKEMERVVSEIWCTV